MPGANLSHDRSTVPNPFSRIQRLARDRRGTSGIEFALIAPILLMIYLGAFELSVGFNMSQKVSQATGTVADILSQKTEVTPTELDGMKNVALSIMAPFSVSNYALKVSGIRVTAPGVGVVAWSRDEKGGTPYAVNTIVAVPADLNVLNTFVVRSEFSVPYELVLMSPPGTQENSVRIMNLSESYYYRQRVGLGITCSLCK
ncbi:pilus assembly protein [Rhizobium sp. Leaf384]|uniref:TadE/TadG family type IV pilus assembly protein n=1 Tax=unclassified Rhizobium TaxID=2613769 RepID=UPI000716348F|nr:MULTISPECIES: TadE/TadG family type IV pilus assembly protein [unclassified Rhizobium]KQS81376.1 pilus assembly protein [Rhizobium sp. Leaf384]KQS87285.1 pilus assembly protein [Rhizobium sp. Leaf383]